MRGLHASHKAAALALVVLLALLVPGCNSLGDTHVTLLCSSAEGYYYKNLIEGAKQAAIDHGASLTVHTLSPDESASAYIGFAFTDRMEALLLALESSDIPQNYEFPVSTITINSSSLAPTNVLANLGSSNYTIGADLYRQAMQNGGAQPEIMLISNTEDPYLNYHWESLLGIDREAFIARPVYCEGDARLAYLQAKDTLETYPNISAIVCQNEVATTGAIKAVRELNRPGLIFGHDINDDIAKALEDGFVNVSYVSNAYGLGYRACEMLIQNLDALTPPTSLTFDPIVVTRENLFLDSISKIIFPID